VTYSIYARTFVYIQKFIWVWLRIWGLRERSHRYTPTPKAVLQCCNSESGQVSRSARDGLHTRADPLTCAIQSTDKTDNGPNLSSTDPSQTTEQGRATTQRSGFDPGSCGICGGQSGIAAGFLRVHLFPPTNYHSTNCSTFMVSIPNKLGHTVTLLTSRRSSFRIPVVTPIIRADVLRGFPQSLQANFGPRSISFMSFPTNNFTVRRYAAPDTHSVAK
jgi:hypothetical protein